MTRGLGDEIYSGAASFGKLRAVIGAIFGTIIGIGLIIGGIVSLRHKTKLTGKTTGTSIDNQNHPQPVPVPPCSSTSDKDNNQSYQCHFKLQYQPDKKKYTKIFDTSSSTNYADQTEITVYYNPDDPTDASLTKDDYHTVGYVFLGFGVFLLLASWIGLWIVYHYKFAAAASGAAGAIDMIRSI
jgi:hypothetical protein